MRALVLISLLLVPAAASAGAWTRDQGKFYLNLNYSRIRASGYFLNGTGIVSFGDGIRYTQQVLGHYGEVGLISRWLTATVEWQAYRHASLVRDEPNNPSDGSRAVADGIGDLRVGAWTGLVTRPVRLSLGATVGFPLGDPRPQASPTAEQECLRATMAGMSSMSCDAVTDARSLPTGDGEFDFEVRAALGHSFGGWHRWPLQHYVVAEAGVWLRTQGFPPGFVYRAELGIKFPWRFIERFWFIGRLAGIEPLITHQTRDDTGGICQGTAAFSGLGACVTYVAYGFDVFGRIYEGLGASIGLDSAFRGHLVPTGANLRVALSYQY